MIDHGHDGAQPVRMRLRLMKLRSQTSSRTSVTIIAGRKLEGGRGSFTCVNAVVALAPLHIMLAAAATAAAAIAKAETLLLHIRNRHMAKHLSCVHLQEGSKRTS